MIILIVILFDCESESDQCFLKFRAVSFIFVTQLSYLTMESTPGKLHGMGKEQLRWEKEKKVVPLVEQSQEILAWLEKLSYQ